MAELSDIPVSDNFQPVPGVDYGDDVVETTPEVQPEVPSTVNEPEPVTESVKEEPAQPAEKVERQKPKPIAALLEKKHELENQLEQERQARAELEAQITELSSRRPSVQADDDIKSLAQEYGVDETLLSRLVDTARKGVNSELPPEVQQLLAERQAEKQQQEELQAFEVDFKSLIKTFDSEPIDSVKDKLMELAYSDALAPDGEPFFKKPLHELYFKFIKPTVEPGTVTAESSQGGSQSTEIVDFEAIFDRDDPAEIEKMDSATFNKYNTWVREHKESRTPIKRG